MCINEIKISLNESPSAQIRYHPILRTTVDLPTKMILDSFADSVGLWAQRQTAGQGDIALVDLVAYS